MSNSKVMAAAERFLSGTGTLAAFIRAVGQEMPVRQTPAPPVVQTAPVPLTLKPGAPAAPGVYPTMALLVAAAAPYIAAGQPIEVAIDDTLAPAVVTGVAALSNYAIASGRADGAQATLVFNAGGGLQTSPTAISNVAFNANALAAGQGVVNVTANTRLVATDAQFVNTGLGRIFRVADNVTFNVQAHGKSDLSGGTALVIESLGAGAIVNVDLYDAAKMDALSLGGVGTNQVFLQSSAARASASTPNYGLAVTSSGVFFVTKTVLLAELQAAGAVPAAAVLVGTQLPPICEVLRAEINVSNALTGPNPGFTAVATLEAVGETPGALLGTTNVAVLGTNAIPGTNPVVSRGNQQLQLSVALGGAGNTMANLATGTINVRLLCVLALDAAVQP
jgi:hypothetical protein